MAYQVETRRRTTETPRSNDRAVNTFVVRRWSPDRADERYEIAHVQSGQRIVVTDVSSASAWIGEFSRPDVCPDNAPEMDPAK
jgi:hypothetical protein